MRLVIRLASVSHLCGIMFSCLLGDCSHKQVIHCLLGRATLARLSYMAVSSWQRPPPKPWGGQGQAPRRKGQGRKAHLSYIIYCI